METSNLLGAEFKTLVIRMLTELSEDQLETKDTLILIKKQFIERKNTLTEIN